MTRLYLMAGAASLVLCLLVALWWQVQRNADLRNQRDAANETINSTEDFNDAASNPDYCPWLDRLRGSCPD
jgi:Flp pilus assembly protein TadB